MVEPCRFIVACAQLWADINGFAIPPSFIYARTGGTLGKMTSQQGGFSGLGAVTETMAIFRLEF